MTAAGQNDRSISKRLWAWWPHGKDFEVRKVRPFMAAAHRRGAVGHTDKINQRVHRRIRSGGGVFCFQMLDQAQDGLCVHEIILPNA